MINDMINRAIIMSCCILAISVARGQSLTLEECYRLAGENYPAVRKLELVSRSAEYTIKNAHKKYLPQVSFSGQATYQSETINYGDLAGNLPVAITIPRISKDQYKIQGEITQQLFDGGSTRFQNEVTRAGAALQKQNIEAELYAVRERISAIFFSILLLDARLAQTQLSKATLEGQLEKTEAQYKNGTAFSSDVNELKAEVENINMNNTEYAANRNAYLRMLSLFTGKEIASSSELVKPVSVHYPNEINRVELQVFDSQRSIYQAQEEQLKSTYLPKISAFLQGAYGRPTLNPIKNEFGPWFITGIRLNWSLGSLYTLKNQREIYHLSRLTSDAEKETFLYNVKLDMVEQDEHVKKYRQLIRQDETAIALRKSITESASAQLAGGVITTYEYIQKVNSESAARQNLVLHQIQLLQAQYNHKLKSGN